MELLVLLASLAVVEALALQDRKDKWELAERQDGLGLLDQWVPLGFKESLDLLVRCPVLESRVQRELVERQDPLEYVVPKAQWVSLDLLE